MSVNNWLEELLLFECLPTLSVALCMITFEMSHCSPQVWLNNLPDCQNKLQTVTG
jgi:hypothetical protein